MGGVPLFGHGLISSEDLWFVYCFGVTGSSFYLVCLLTPQLKLRVQLKHFNRLLSLLFSLLQVAWFPLDA